MKFNRILASVLAIAVVGANMPAVSVNFPKISMTANAEETESYLEYETLEDGTIEITGCDQTVATVEIPAEIDGKKVTSIGEKAFEECMSLTEITIPDSVTSIGDWAFCDCSGLTSITIPDNVTSIGYNAFAICSGLTEITIPESVTSIGGSAFNYCTGLTEITIPDSVTSIGELTFANCTGLTKITMSNSITSIEEQTFCNCINLKEITIPDNVISIGDMAFKGCLELTEINIPDSIKSIGIFAFAWCSKLTEINIPDSVKVIGKNTFYYCTGLTEITIPASVTSIGPETFSMCENLTSITILNPNCEIFEGRETISNGRDDNNSFYFNGTIYGYENSTAQAYAEKYKRKFESLGETPATKVIAGDANCDGKVSIADATAILQHLGNQDKYGLSAQGLKNADVDGNDGVSTNDALVIQKVDAKILTVEQLPLKK